MLTVDSIVNSLKLPIVNEYFKEYIFPPIEDINKASTDEWDNPIQLKTVMIFGSPGVGKTSVMRSITEEANRIYGKDNVNAVMNDSIEDMLVYGLDNKLIQIQCIDDYTMSKEDSSIVKKYFEIRKIWKEVYGIKNGLIVAIFGAHRYHSSIKEIRSISDVTIIKTNSSDRYDKSVIKQIIKQEGYDDLKIIDEFKSKFTELKNYSIIGTKTEQTGLVMFPLETINSLRDVKDIKKKFSLLSIMNRKKVILYTK
jgi:Cdc6-like AAA superfamily ATPase